MPIPALPVFVSSTWTDLEPEREAVEALIQRFRETKFVGMEYFGSRDETTRRASLDEVDRSMVYVGILAARYGSGITEDEYRRASARGLYRLIYFKDATVPDELRETDPEKAAKLVTLKAELKRDHDVTTFDNPDDLAAKVATDLHRWLFDKYLTPILERAARGELPHSRAQELLSGVRDTTALSPALLAQLMARHQLRAPVGDFVGRGKEIAELTGALRRGTSAAISGISGMGGIGKTELALYVANQLRDAYPDAQLVVDMRGTDDPPRDPSDALASCVRAFVGLEKKLPDDLEELKRLYTSALQGKRALILLDNARDNAQVRHLMPPTGSALMVTSRETIALPGMKRLTLEQLQQSEARELLTSIAPHVAPDIADQICYLCGYLPLAVRAAGSLLAITPDLDPVSYAAELGDERTRLERIGVDPMIGVSVEASLGLSYARLTLDAARVFRLLSVFPATFDAAAEETICQDPGHKHLSDLLRRSLVLYNPATHRYRLHDLARLFADSHLDKDERSAVQLRHAAYYLEILNRCGRFYLQGGESIRSSLALFDTEQRNIEAGQKCSSHRAGNNDAAARLCNEYAGFGSLLHLRQHPHERITWLEAALASSRQLKDRAAEGRHLGNMGIAYGILGDTRHAIELFEQALAAAREIGNRRAEGAALGNLGLAYKNLGEANHAIKFNEQQLTIAREVGDRRGEGNALGSLGLAYANLGELDRAIELYEKHLAIAREIGDRVGEGIALSNLGVAYENLGETARAIELYEQSLVIARELGDLRGEGHALFNAAIALDMLGDRARAIVNAEAAFEIFEHIKFPHAEVVRGLLTKWREEA